MRKTLQTLYKMDLIETFCFINTIGEDWWFIKDEDMLLHMHGSSPAGYKIISSNLMGPNKYR